MRSRNLDRFFPICRFFVAIPPEMRKEWGSKMRDLLKPGGFLITLVFPMDPPQDYGPPFYVRPEHYVEVLVYRKL